MRKIFHVDDDVDVREVVCFALTEQDYRVESFGNPLEAIQIMSSHTEAEVPGLILVDYSMPGLNGLSFIDKARKLAAYQRVPFVLCSAQGDFLGSRIPSDVHILPKPMELEDLLALVRRYIPDNLRLG
jgi:CheY-like chemotaxis protein